MLTVALSPEFWSWKFWSPGPKFSLKNMVRRLIAQPQLPLFQQCSVKAKMHTFHANMATLDTPVCTTCSEKFPGLQLYSNSTECLRCSRDKHIPKVYSSANNMDPGPIPPQLQVSSTYMILVSVFPRVLMFFLKDAPAYVIAANAACLHLLVPPLSW